MPKNLFSEDNKSIIGLFVLILVSIISFTVFKIHDRDLMAKSLQSAIEKGVDPMTVRCSYSSDSDAVCVAFASIQQKQQEVINANKR
jgi:cation transport regulator ChaB